jgi:hypothetical protein
LSASELQHESPAWLSAAPDWWVLLEGARLDLGYPKELLDMIYVLAVTSGDTSSSSSTSSGSVAYSQQDLDSCVSSWNAMLSIMLYPLDGKDSTAAYGVLKTMVDGALAATHVAHLPVVLLAVAQAVVKQQTAGTAVFVGLDANAFRVVYGHGRLGWRMAKPRQQQQQQQERQQTLEAKANWQVPRLALLLLQHLVTSAASAAAAAAVNYSSSSSSSSSKKRPQQQQQVQCYPFSLQSSSA